MRYCETHSDNNCRGQGMWASDDRARLGHMCGDSKRHTVDLMTSSCFRILALASILHLDHLLKFWIFTVPFSFSWIASSFVTLLYVELGIPCAPRGVWLVWLTYSAVASTAEPGVGLGSRQVVKCETATSRYARAFFFTLCRVDEGGGNSIAGCCLGTTPLCDNPAAMPCRR